MALYSVLSISRLFWHSSYQRCHHKCQSNDRKISQNIKCYLIWSMKCTFFAQFNFNSQCSSCLIHPGPAFVIRLWRLVQSNFKGNNINKSLPRTLTKRTTLTLQWVWDQNPDDPDPIFHRFIQPFTKWIIHRINKFRAQNCD